MAVRVIEVGRRQVFANAAATETHCPGSGLPWWTGTGNPICKVCHVGYRALGVAKPRRRRQPPITSGNAWLGKVPTHTRRR